MAVDGHFDKPLFINIEELLHVQCIETSDELDEFYISEENIDNRLMEILSYWRFDQRRNTRVGVVDFWKSVDLLGLQYKYVPDGVLIYNRPSFQGHFCEPVWLGDYEDLITFENLYASSMEREYLPTDVVVVVEASDQAQDWISLEMVKPHVRVMKEKLNFTDRQIILGLQSLHERGVDITFMSLLNTLVPAEDAILNMYVGTGKFAFSADVKLCLRYCHAAYPGEPTQEQFELQWNRIKEHLTEQVEIERTRADRTEQEKRRAEQEKQDALNREALLEQEKKKAEQEKKKAEQEKKRAEQEKRRAEQEKKRAEQEKLEAIRNYNTAIAVRNEAVDETIQALNREELLKKEKEEQKARAEKLENELAKMAALFAEKEQQLLLQIQQMAGCMRA